MERSEAKKRRRCDGARRGVRTMIEVHVLTCAYLLGCAVCMRMLKRGGAAALSSVLPRGRAPPMAPPRFSSRATSASARNARDTRASIRARVAPFVARGTRTSISPRSFHRLRIPFVNCALVSFQ